MKGQYQRLSVFEFCEGSFQTFKFAQADARLYVEEFSYESNPIVEQNEGNDFIISIV